MKPNFNEPGNKELTLKVFQSRRNGEAEREKTINVNISKNTISVDKKMVCLGDIVTATVANIPAGVTINWNYSSNLSYVSGQGTSSIKLTNDNPMVGGEGWVSMNITTECGETNLSKKTFSVGRPTITKREEELGTCYSPWFQYNAPKIEGVTYTWTVNNSNVNISAYGDVCFLNADIPDNTTINYMLTVTMTNNETGCSSSISALGQYYQPIFCECQPNDSSCQGGGDDPGNGGPTLPNPRSIQLDDQSDLSFMETVDVYPNLTGPSVTLGLELF